MDAHCKLGNIFVTHKVFSCIFIIRAACASAAGTGERRTKSEDEAAVEQFPHNVEIAHLHCTQCGAHLPRAQVPGSVVGLSPSSQDMDLTLFSRSPTFYYGS